MVYVFILTPEFAGGQEETGEKSRVRNTGFACGTFQSDGSQPVMVNGSELAGQRY